MIFLNRYKNCITFQFSYNVDCGRIKQRQLFTIINQLWIEYTTDMDKINLNDITVYYDNKITTCGINHCYGTLIRCDVFWQFNKCYSIAKTIGNNEILYHYLTVKRIINFEPYINPVVLYEKNMQTGRVNYLDGKKIEHRYNILQYCCVM